ncbi:MAG: sulfite exporter TauE/SafE family protein [Microgenomates group bacterium]
MDQTNLLLIFLTGLTTGGLSCLAVQGGLLASVVSPTEEKLKADLKNHNQTLPIISFLTAKIVAHTILGFFLGLLGSAISLTPYLRGWFQIAIGVYLVGVALSLLDAHPIFRYFIIQPPKFLSRLVKNQSKSKSLFAPALLGALTIFIPCAVTQAMVVVALGTGNPLLSAAIMFSFVLGTSPTFFILGVLFNKLGEKFQSWFYKVAATILVTMAIFSINGGISLMGSIYTLQNFVEAAQVSFSGVRLPSIAGALARDNQGVQEVAITVSSSGYSPQHITLKKGIPARLILKTSGTNGCARAFTIPSLRLQKILPVTGTETLEFTPTKAGPLVFTCSMGMYTGVFNVI